LTGFRGRWYNSVMREKSPKKKVLTPRPTGDEDRQAIAEAARLFGRMGGKARVARMTAQERSEAARRAVLTRWARARAKTKTVVGRRRVRKQAR
jgi:hypothetical protein